MKKVFYFFTILLLFSSEMNSQNWEGNLSGTVGLLNFKVRIQYELPIGEKYSTGANLNYYFVNWTGPLIEPFFRVYAKKHGNYEGWFLQGKLGYGNLKSLDEYFEFDPNYTSKRWSTFGGGVAIGNKFFITDKLTIEPLMGLRLYSPQNFNKKEYDIYDDYVWEDLSWGLTTGFPLDLQIKIGYQF
jgi:hypothetical protein